MKKLVLMIVPALICGMVLISCSTDSLTDDHAEAILGKWELIGSAMYEGYYNENDFGTTWEFLKDNTLRICLGSRGGIMYGDPNRIGSYTIDDGYLVYRIEEGVYEGPWICKFYKNQLELTRVTRVTPVTPADTEMLDIYISNFVYFKRIN